MTDTLAPKPSDDAFAATAPLLKADNLCVGFRTDAGTVNAVSDVSFAVDGGGITSSGSRLVILSTKGLCNKSPGTIADSTAWVRESSRRDAFR